MAKILILRHGVAEDREKVARTGGADGGRALTPEGRKRIKRCVDGLHHLVPQVSLIATSPVLRALQTAEILARQYKKAPLVETESLVPGGSGSDLLDWLREQASDDTLALVGHEPDLGHWVSWVLTGSDRPFMQLGKGGACLIEFSNQPVPGRAQLHWLLPPRQLRRLGRK
jgi:phosphohistidine phosphatase